MPRPPTLAPPVAIGLFLILGPSWEVARFLAAIGVVAAYFAWATSRRSVLDWCEAADAWRVRRGADD